MACFFHKWDGCKCTKCGQTRDKQHEWENCKCKKCGEEIHDFKEKKCTRCGAVIEYIPDTLCSYCNGAGYIEEEGFTNGDWGSWTRTCPSCNGEKIESKGYTLITYSDGSYSIK